METAKTMKKSWYQMKGTWFVAIVLVAVATFFAIEAFDQPHAPATYNAYGVSEDYMETLAAANSYMDYRPFSMAGLTDHLETSGYEASAVAWAVEMVNGDTDWNNQAVLYGEYLLANHGYTVDELYDSLVEEGFTSEQANYAIDSLTE